MCVCACFFFLRGGGYIRILQSIRGDWVNFIVTQSNFSDPPKGNE